MDKKTLFIVVIGLIFVVCFALFSIKNKKNQNSGETSLTYVEEKDDISGEEKSNIYDQNSNRVIAEDVEESQLKMYQDDPNFEIMNKDIPPIDELNPAEDELGGELIEENLE